MVHQYKIFICIVLLALVGMQMAADNEAAEKDLDCAKDSEGKVIACKGKNPIYEETEKKINSNSDEVKTKINVLQTRSGGPVSSGPRPPIGGNNGGPQGSGCPSSYGGRGGGGHGEQGKCATSLNEIYSPSLLYNSNQQPRFVLQLTSFNQFVKLSVCESTGNYCSRGQSCQQKNQAYNLLVWDPFYPEGGLSVESFQIPDGCCCS